MHSVRGGCGGSGGGVGPNNSASSPLSGLALIGSTNTVGRDKKALLSVKGGGHYGRNGGRARSVSIFLTDCFQRSRYVVVMCLFGLLLVLCYNRGLMGKGRGPGHAVGGGGAPQKAPLGFAASVDSLTQYGTYLDDDGADGHYDYAQPNYRVALPPSSTASYEDTIAAVLHCHKVVGKRDGVNHYYSMTAATGGGACVPMPQSAGGRNGETKSGGTNRAAHPIFVLPKPRREGLQALFESSRRAVESLLSKGAPLGGDTDLHKLLLLDAPITELRVLPAVGVLVDAVAEAQRTYDAAFMAYFRDEYDGDDGAVSDGVVGRRIVLRLDTMMGSTRLAHVGTALTKLFASPQPHSQNRSRSRSPSGSPPPHSHSYEDSVASSFLSDYVELHQSRGDAMADDGEGMAASDLYLAFGGGDDPSSLTVEVSGGEEEERMGGGQGAADARDGRPPTAPMRLSVRGFVGEMAPWEEGSDAEGGTDGGSRFLYLSLPEWRHTLSTAVCSWLSFNAVRLADEETERYNELLKATSSNTKAGTPPPPLNATDYSYLTPWWCRGGALDTIEEFRKVLRSTVAAEAAAAGVADPPRRSSLGVGVDNPSLPMRSDEAAYLARRSTRGGSGGEFDHSGGGAVSYPIPFVDAMCPPFAVRIVPMLSGGEGKGGVTLEADASGAVNASRPHLYHYRLETHVGASHLGLVQSECAFAITTMNTKATRAGPPVRMVLPFPSTTSSPQSSSRSNRKRKWRGGGESAPDASHSYDLPPPSVLREVEALQSLLESALLLEESRAAAVSHAILRGTVGVLKSRSDYFACGFMETPRGDAACLRRLLTALLHPDLGDQQYTPADISQRLLAVLLHILARDNAFPLALVKAAFDIKAADHGNDYRDAAMREARRQQKRREGMVKGGSSAALTRPSTSLSLSPQLPEEGGPTSLLFNPAAIHPFERVGYGYNPIAIADEKLRASVVEWIIENYYGFPMGEVG